MADQKTLDAPSPAEEQSQPAAAAAAHFEDSDLVTVLYNYGVVPADNIQRLGGVNGLVIFKGGVARHVPYKVARLWREGKRVEPLLEGGERVVAAAGGPINVLVLPDNATEADMAAAINPEAASAAHPSVTPARLGAAMRGMTPATIIDALGREDATFLALALCEELGIRTSTAFSDATAAPASAKRPATTRR